jgi:hypothetical protein
MDADARRAGKSRIMKRALAILRPQPGPTPVIRKTCEEIATMTVASNGGVFTAEQWAAIDEACGKVADVLGEEVAKIQQAIETRWQVKFQELENKMLRAENQKLRSALDRDDILPDYNEVRAALTRN